MHFALSLVALQFSLSEFKVKISPQFASVTSVLNSVIQGGGKRNAKK